MGPGPWGQPDDALRKPPGSPKPSVATPSHPLSPQPPAVCPWLQPAAARGARGQDTFTPGRRSSHWLDSSWNKRPRSRAQWCGDFIIFFIVCVSDSRTPFESVDLTGFEDLTLNPAQGSDKVALSLCHSLLMH